MVNQNLYKVDSFKILFDRNLFSKINIPEKYFLIDENGEVLQEIKKKGFEVPYNDFTSIYIASYTKRLRKLEFSKVVLLFSSKVAENYFNGVKLDDISKVLNFLKSKDIINFTSLKTLLNNAYFKDLDICKDVVFSHNDKNKLLANLKKQVKAYKGNNTIGTGIKLYNNKNNFGLSVNHRNGSTMVKPFFKIYNKLLEFQNKHQEFFNSLNSNLRWFLNENLVIRVEFTLKNKSYFDKFNISNNVIKFYNEIEFNQKLFSEIQVYFINANFVKKIIKAERKELSPQQTIIANLLLLNIEDNKHKRNLIFYENLFIAETTGTEATRLRKLFEFIYSHISNFSNLEISDNIEFSKNYNELF